MIRWPIRLLALMVALGVALPTAADATNPQTVTVVSGKALVGTSSPRFVVADCGLNTPMATAPAADMPRYVASTYPGHAGKVAHFAPPPYELKGYGVLVTSPLNQVSRLSVQAAGTHGQVIAAIQYPATGGAVMVGSRTVDTVDRYAWLSHQGLDGPLAWVRYFKGVSTSMGVLTTGEVARSYPAAGAASVGFVFGCTSEVHQFDVDSLTVGNWSSAKTYNFEAGPVGVKVSATSAQKVKLKKRLSLHGVLSPAVAGIPVTVYQWTGKKKRVAGRVRTNSSGAYSLKIRARRAGTFRWSAAVARSSSQPWVSGVSRKVRVKVVKPPKPKPVRHPSLPPTHYTPPPIYTPPPTTGTGHTGCTAVICAGRPSTTA